MVEILKLYIQETPKDLQLIETSLLENDMGGAKAGTHKIKTNLAMLGIRDPADFMAAMHNFPATAEVTENVMKLFASFKSELMTGLEEMEKDFFHR